MITDQVSQALEVRVLRPCTAAGYRGGVSESDFLIVRAAGFAAALLLAWGLQRATPFVGARGSWRTNGTLWAVNAIVIGAICGGCACTAAHWATAHGIGILGAVSAPGWLAVPITIATLDFVAYAWHRANHQLPFLWRFHRVHHSDLAFTTSTALRFHPGELLLSLPIRLAVILLLGPPVLAILAFELTFAIANLIEHGDIRLPDAIDRTLSAAVVTPSLHRRHHWCGPSRLATNFGTISTLWDRALGTYAANAAAIARPTGVPGIATPLSLRSALTLPFQAI
jgi:sterol desaturase/sphingolipid hydroxylase (fatty acid hydroxylase superfamily)